MSEKMTDENEGREVREAREDSYPPPRVDGITITPDGGVIAIRTSAGEVEFSKNGNDKPPKPIASDK